MKHNRRYDQLVFSEYKHFCRHTEIESLTPASIVRWRNNFKLFLLGKFINSCSINETVLILNTKEKAYSSLFLQSIFSTFC